MGQADRLVRQRRLLESELHKFTNVTPVAERYARHYGQEDERFAAWHNPLHPKYATRGEMNLRRLLEEARLADQMAH